MATKEQAMTKWIWEMDHPELCFWKSTIEAAIERIEREVNKPIGSGHLLIGIEDYWDEEE